MFCCAVSVGSSKFGNQILCLCGALIVYLILWLIADSVLIDLISRESMNKWRFWIQSAFNLLCGLFRSLLWFFCRVLLVIWQRLIIQGPLRWIFWMPFCGVLAYWVTLMINFKTFVCEFSLRCRSCSLIPWWSRHLIEFGAGLWFRVSIICLRSRRHDFFCQSWFGVYFQLPTRDFCVC